MMKLYEIDEEILGCVDAETGEIFDMDKFEELSMARDHKVESLCLWYKNLTAEAEALKAEKQAFEKRQKAAENKAKGIKEFLAYYLNGTKFKTTKADVSFRKSETLDISEGATIPEEYLKYKEPDVNKTELKKAIKSGLHVSGVQLVINNNIQIK